RRAQPRVGVKAQALIVQLGVRHRLRAKAALEALDARQPFAGPEVVPMQLSCGRGFDERHVEGVTRPQMCERLPHCGAPKEQLRSAENDHTARDWMVVALREPDLYVVAAVGNQTLQ